MKSLVFQRPLTRLLHHSSVQNYQINYEHLKTGSSKNVAPQTVEANVKNVVGWRGGAKRGFLAAYPDCIHVLTSVATNDALDSVDSVKWYRKVLTHNLSKNVLSKNYGLLVPITYRQLVPDASKEEMNLAHVLGWTVEMIRAAAIVVTDTVAQHSQTRYGSGYRRHKNYVTWAEKHELGNKAFNDALLIDRGVWVLLKHYFGHQAAIYYEPITRAQRSRALGRALGYSLLTVDEAVETRLDDFNINNYKALTRSHVSQTNYCLPISLAMQLAGLRDEELHKVAHNILHEMGYYREASRDLEAFENPHGTDIQDGRLNWLIVLAVQRANKEQKRLLYENYGFHDEEKVAIVKQIYKELKLKRMLYSHIDLKKEEILNRIQLLNANHGLSQEFFFKLLENMDMNNIS